MIALVLFLTVLLRFALVFAVIYIILPRGAACPRCAEPLALVHRPILRLLLPVVEHRWCLDCGWTGLVRPTRQSRVMRRTARS